GLLGPLVICVSGGVVSSVTVVVFGSRLLSVSGSVEPEVRTGSLTASPACVASAVIVTVASAPAASEPSEQVRVGPPLQEPRLGVTVMLVRLTLAGSASVRTTAAASSGPAL